MNNTMPPRHSRSDDRWNERAYRQSKATGWRRWVAGWPHIFKIAGGFLALTVLLAGITRLFPVIGRAALTGFAIKAAGHLTLAIFFSLIGAHLIKQIRPRLRNRSWEFSGTGPDAPSGLFNGRAQSIRALVALLLSIALVFNLWMGIQGILQVYRDRGVRPVRTAITVTQFRNRPSRVHLGQRRAPHLIGVTEQGLPIEIEINGILLHSLQTRYGRPSAAQPAGGRLVIYYYPNTGILNAVEIEGA